MFGQNPVGDDAYLNACCLMVLNRVFEAILAVFSAYLHHPQPLEYGTQLLHVSLAQRRER